MEPNKREHSPGPDGDLPDRNVRPRIDIEETGQTDNNGQTQNETPRRLRLLVNGELYFDLPPRFVTFNGQVDISISGQRVFVKKSNTHADVIELTTIQTSQITSTHDTRGNLLLSLGSGPSGMSLTFGPEPVVKIATGGITFVPTTAAGSFQDGVTEKLDNFREELTDNLNETLVTIRADLQAQILQHNVGADSRDEMQRYLEQVLGEFEEEQRYTWNNMMEEVQTTLENTVTEELRNFKVQLEERLQEQLQESRDSVNQDVEREWLSLREVFVSELAAIVDEENQD